MPCRAAHATGTRTESGAKTVKTGTSTPETSATLAQSPAPCRLRACITTAGDGDGDGVASAAIPSLRGDPDDAGESDAVAASTASGDADRGPSADSKGSNSMPNGPHDGAASGVGSLPPRASASFHSFAIVFNRALASPAHRPEPHHRLQAPAGVASHADLRCALSGRTQIQNEQTRRRNSCVITTRFTA